jgi:hypothetical protein
MQVRRKTIEEQNRLVEGGLHRNVSNDEGAWLRWVVILPPATKLSQVATTSPFRIGVRPDRRHGKARHRS